MDYTLIAQGGAYAFTGNQVILAYQPRRLGAQEGVFVLLGQDVALRPAYRISLGVGSFILSATRVGLMPGCSDCCEIDQYRKDILGQAAPGAAVEVDLFTATKDTIVKSITVVNRGPGAGTFRIAFVKGGGVTANQHYAFYDNALGVKTTTLAEEFRMNTGDVLRVEASTGNFSFSAFGEEKK